MSTRTADRSGMFAARTSQRWGWLAASGVIGIVVGIVALFFPGLTILTATAFLGVALVVQGVLELAAASHAGATGRGWVAALGVLTLVAGVLVIFNPGGGILVLVWGLILWFVVAAVNDFSAAYATPEHRGWNIAVGAVSVLAALVLLVSPDTAVGVLALVIALGFIIRGGVDLGLALMMRRSAAGPR